MSPFYALNGGGGGWLESRVDTQWTPESDSSRTGYGMLQSATNSATDSQTFTQFRFAAAKSIRTSTIILASFNTIAALVTAVGILTDTYQREKKENKRFRFSRNGFSFVPATEAFPLILSAGIVVQGITFAVAQSTGLDSLFGSGCTLIAMFMFPAILDRSSNFCITSLFWFLAHYSVGCFGLLVGISALLLVCAVVVFVRLHRSNKVELVERAAASRMVYYMALAIISEAFMIPYFYVIAFGGQRRHALNLSMVAAVVANISGLMTGGLYLFLKFNASSTIGPKNKDADYENRREGYNKAERYESSGLDFDSHIMRPVTSPGRVRRLGSNASLIRTARDEEEENSPTTPTILFRAPTIPEPAQMPSTSSAAANHMQKESYSLFPTHPGAPTARPSAALLSSTTYTPVSSSTLSDASTLKPPPSMGFLAARGHRRNSSLVSSATVQIGLRLSSVENVPPLLSPGTDVHGINCPKLDRKNTIIPERKQQPLSPRLITDFDNNTPVVNKEYLRRDSMTYTEPEAEGEKHEQEQEQLETLSPTIYNPKSPADEPVLLSSKVYTPASPAQKLETLSPKVYSPTGPAAAEEVVTLSAKTYSPTTPTKAKLPSPRSPQGDDGGELLSSARYTP
ncbi:hypothetical protein B0T09DRAFT_395166 [Sordaria sp. MPI-SDFR-AT-0083]|nr:hypothetical protein B0T09DRAFT_395166 [Sordaria sp. MPI-SDFR-AT-0083]